MNSGRSRQAVLLALAAVGLWSTVAVAFKLALRELEPLDLVALASMVSWISLAFAMGIMRLTRSGKSSESPSEVGAGKTVFAALLGLLNPILYYAVLFAAYDRLPAQAAQPLNYTWPLFLALLAAPIAKKMPTVLDLIGLVVSLAGVILISHRPGGSEEILDGLGVLLALGSGIIWALYWLLGDRLAMNGLKRLFTGFSLAAVLLAILWWKRGMAMPSSALGWGMVLWVGLFEMGITFLFWNGALERAERPAVVGNLVYLGPFISLIWIRVILGESIRPATIIGLAVIVIGILLGQGVLIGPLRKALGSSGKTKSG